MSDDWMELAATLEDGEEVIISNSGRLARPAVLVRVRAVVDDQGRPTRHHGNVYATVHEKSAGFVPGYEPMPLLSYVRTMLRDVRAKARGGS